MDLVDNYVNTIRWNLPRGTRPDDIIAELRDVIASRIEDREAALDRPLNRGEISAVLRDFGHPLVVAASYGNQQSLIGPDLFPFYWFSLKVVMAICVAILLISTATDALLGDEPLIRAVMQGLHGSLWSLLGNAGLVTLIFAVIERTGWLAGHLRSWSPEQLPDLGKLKSKPKSAWEAVFETAVGIAVLAWWLGLIAVPFAFHTSRGVTIAPAPVWADYHWPIALLLAGSVAFSLVQLLRPRWQAVQAIIALALAAGATAILLQVYRTGQWVTVTSTTMSTEQLANLQRSLHLSLKITIVVIALVWLSKAAAVLWRLYNDRRG